MTSKVKNLNSDAHFDTFPCLQLVRSSPVFGNFSEVLVKVFDIVFFKNSILNFLEPLYVVDLVAAVRLLSISNQVRFSKPLW